MGTRIQRVVLETDRGRVAGDLTLPEDGYRSRLSDFLNREGIAFIPLTNAEVTPHDNGPSEAHAFIAVGRDHIRLAYELRA